MKKGSITLFVIIGLVIVIIGSLIMLRIDKSDTPGIGLSSEKTNTKYYIDTCLDYTTTQAVELYGFSSEEEISLHVNSKLLPCLGDFKFVKGYEVNYGIPKSNVIINDEVVFVDLNFPVELKKENSRIELEEFQYSLKRTNMYKVRKGLIEKGSIFFSNDGNLAAMAEEDTRAQDNLGNPLDEISFKMLDKNFDSLNNGVVLGNVVYEGLPGGASFDPPLKITIGLRKENLPQGYPINAPMIAWYDREGDIWRTYPNLGVEEDDFYYYYSALVSHFTPMAVVTCGAKLEGESNVPDSIDMGIVFRSRVSPFKKDYWRENEEQVNGEKGFHLIPEVMKNATCIEQKDVIEYIEFNLKDDCSGLIKDWDKDDANNDCNGLSEEIKTQIIEKIECYFGNKDCDKKFIQSESQGGWLYDPYDLGKVSGDGIKDDYDQCGIITMGNIPEFSLTPVTEDEFISHTMVDDVFYATPMTYGFPDLDSVGGSGKFIIELKGGGDSCVEDWGIASKKDGTYKGITDNDVGICSDGDACTWSLLDTSDQEIQDLQSGENILKVSVENKEDHYATASGILVFKGEGIQSIESLGINSDLGSNTGSTGSSGLSELGGGGEYYDMAAGDFREIFPGIEIKKVDSAINPEIQLPGPLVYYVVKIDLNQSPNFFVTPPQPILMQTSAFLAEYAPSQNLVLAINGGPFEYGGGNEQIGGYAASSGVVYSKENYGIEEATIVVDKNNKVGFVDDNLEAYHAVSGFQAIVMDGKTRGVHTPGHPEYDPDSGKGYHLLHPRTSVGIDKKKGFMYIVVVDGRSNLSIGINIVNLGKIHVHHGSTYAVNLDGGGSSALVINQANTAMIVNTPSDGGDRAVANHFGVGVKGVLLQP